MPCTHHFFFNTLLFVCLFVLAQDVPDSPVLALSGPWTREFFPKEFWFSFGDTTAHPPSLLLVALTPLTRLPCLGSSALAPTSCTSCSAPQTLSQPVQAEAFEHSNQIVSLLWLPTHKWLHSTQSRSLSPQHLVPALVLWGSASPSLPMSPAPSSLLKAP